MRRMIEEFPAHYTSGKVNSHYNFYRGTGRERYSWQEQYAQLCIWILCANIRQHCHNSSRLQREKINQGLSLI